MRKASVALAIFLVLAPTASRADDAQFIQILEPFIASHRGNACRVYSLSCETNNPGAVTCASGSLVAGRPLPCIPQIRKYQGVTCGKKNDTACFESDDRGIGAMADIFLTKIRAGCTSIYSILQGCDGINGQKVRGYSSTHDGNASRLYADTIKKWTGIDADTTLDPNNAINIGKILTAMARYESGNGGIKFSAQQLRQGLAYAYGSAQLPAGTPGFTPRPGPVIRPGDLPLGPLVLNSGGMISPFSGQVITPSVSQGAFPSQLAQPNITQTPVSSQLTGTPVVTTPQSAAQILVQPRSPARGAKMYVSWTSVGMAAQSCALKVGNETRSNTSEGSLSIVATQGTHSFSFSCRDAAGVLRGLSDSITVP